MSRQSQASESKSDRKNLVNVEPSTDGELDRKLSGLAGRPIGFIGGGNGSIQTQAALLADPRLQTTQRHALAAHVGRLQGNVCFRRLVELPGVSDSVVQRHDVEGGCDTPERCAAIRDRLLELVGDVQREDGETWRRARGPIQSFVQSLGAEDTLSLRTMLGEIGSNPDTELQSQVEARLWPRWRTQILTGLRQRTAAARREQPTVVEEEEMEWVGEEEEGPQPARAEQRGLPPLRGTYAPLEGTSEPRRLRQVESGGRTFREGDRSGNWEIRRIEQDWQGVVYVRIHNRSTNQDRSETLADWQARMSFHYLRESTQAMGAIAEAEAAILRELFPAWARIPVELAWIGFVIHQHRGQIQRVIQEGSELVPAIDWLEQNAPTTLQVFVVGIASERAGRAMPTRMNPVEIGRDIGRSIRDIAALVRICLVLSRSVRFSASGAATGIGRFVETLGTHLLAARIRRIAAAYYLGRVATRASSDIRQEVIARVGTELGLSPNDPRIDQLIREFANEETASKVIQVINTLRHFIELCTTLTDAIDHQRPSPTPSSD